jgi:hypothetical protein
MTKNEQRFLPARKIDQYTATSLCCLRVGLAIPEVAIEVLSAEDRVTT